MRPSVGRRTSAASASAIAVLFAGAAIILAHELSSIWGRRHGTWACTSLR